MTHMEDLLSQIYKVEQFNCKHLKPNLCVFGSCNVILVYELWRYKERLNQNQTVHAM